jgi:hypothetical protein
MAEVPVAAGNEMAYSRVHISFVNNNKIQAIYDFAFGDYLAYNNFFDELSRIQSALINDGEVELETGQVASLESTGGLLAIQLYMETLEATKTAMSGLSKLGLKNENKLLTTMM